MYEAPSDFSYAPKEKLCNTKADTFLLSPKVLEIKFSKYVTFLMIQGKKILKKFKNWQFFLDNVM